jgi:hypothetical protein
VLEVSISQQPQKIWCLSHLKAKGDLLIITEILLIVIHKCKLFIIFNAGYQKLQHFTSGTLADNLGRSERKTIFIRFAKEMNI